jgi:hypothetical protein
MEILTHISSNFRIYLFIFRKFQNHLLENVISMIGLLYYHILMKVKNQWDYGKLDLVNQIHNNKNGYQVLLKNQIILLYK